MLRGLLLVTALSFAAGVAASEKQVVFYPSYGFQQGETWVIPLRVWVSEDRALVEKAITRLAAKLGDLDRSERDNFRMRARPFVADDRSRQDIRFRFDQDSAGEEFRVRSKDGSFPRSDVNGIVEGQITLRATKTAELLRSQSSTNGWLTYRTVSNGHKGAGRVRLIGPVGQSVISDIDDTIKVTDIPAGPKIVAKNTFFREFISAPGMADMYRALGDASFHYVSGGPWQMYAALSEFLIGKAGFPEGTFHMKNARKNPLSSDSWEDLHTLASGNATFDQKVSQISEIIRIFPGRKFILIGDSGEKDPEVYREIQSKFPTQVQEVRIRDVVNDREKNPARLDGMTKIPER